MKRNIHPKQLTLGLHHLNLSPAEEMIMRGLAKPPYTCTIENVMCFARCSRHSARMHLSRLKRKGLIWRHWDGFYVRTPAAFNLLIDPQDQPTTYYHAR